MISIGLVMTGIYVTGTAQPPIPPNFTEMDKDGDNRVSEQEFTDFRAKRMAQRAAEGRPMLNADKAPSFANIDTNGDKYLSVDEFDAHRSKMMQRRGKKFGVMGSYNRPKFELLDTNGDGAIQRTEFDNFHTTRPQSCNCPMMKATKLPVDAVPVPSAAPTPVTSVTPVNTDTSSVPNSK